MKKRSEKPKKVVRGMPSAVLLSVVIHAALFLLAGMLVVFTVVKQKEVEFEPPKAVERPKMKLKKPKVKVKKSAKPKPTQRIVSQMKPAKMPDIQLPEMSGMGDGVVNDIGGFDVVPDFNDVKIFGSGQSIGNDFVGTFYDLKRDRNGRPLPTVREEYADELTKFIRSGWKSSYLAKYYQSPKKLYATSFMMGSILSTLGPKAFGEDTGGWCWLAHYKGQLVYPEDIKFRFWGMGNDILLVRVDGVLVLNGNWHKDGENMYITDIGGKWQSTSSDDARFWYGLNKARVGDWIELKAGEPLDMEVIIGEPGGGYFSAMLAVQIEGEEYERNGQGGPILPMFQTAEPSRDILDAFYRELIPGEVCFTNAPVFRDYVLAKKTKPIRKSGEEVERSSEEMEPASEMRIWSRSDGKQLEAEQVAVMGDKVVLKTPKGKQLKISLSKLSSDDREYLELANPPTFSIDFLKLSDSKLSRYEQSPAEIQWGRDPPRVNDFTFGARVKQRGAGAYNQELVVEYFAIGKELLGNKFILLDRRSGSFTPSRENGRSYTLLGDPVEFVEYDLEEQRRGSRPRGYLITITDRRGHIIQHNASKAWLFENIEKLKKLPVGAYMDETCARVFPTPPKSTKW